MIDVKFLLFEEGAMMFVDDNLYLGYQDRDYLDPEPIMNFARAVNKLDYKFSLFNCYDLTYQESGSEICEIDSNDNISFNDLPHINQILNCELKVLEILAH